MDLATVTANYTDLQRKYKGFTAPTVRILVEGTDISEIVGLSDITVNLGIDSSSTSASFNVLLEYEYMNTDFTRTGISNTIQIGAKVTVKIGYIETEKVFVGVIMSLDYIFEDGEAPYIQVECMDAKNLMMKRKVPGLFKDMKITDVVKELMGKNPASSYIEGTEVESYGENEEMITICSQDDYRFCVENASAIDYEFFISQGKVYYRKTPDSPSCIMTLKPEWGIMSCRMSLSGNDLFQKAIYNGINSSDDENISEKAKISGNFGSYADRMLDGAEKHFLDSGITDPGEASKRANNRMKEASREFGDITCRCVGIPEIGPGRNIKIEGISPVVDGEYYIESVTHTLNTGGFFTEWKARVDTL
ncbi:MAG: hypothetical protein FWC91_09130 [Defluviitaleaceae bacterium]|nr:hypothetical protein [Defluviitaleaceae bacterium]